MLVKMGHFLPGWAEVGIAVLCLVIWFSCIVAVRVIHQAGLFLHAHDLLPLVAPATGHAARRPILELPVELWHSLYIWGTVLIGHRVFKPNSGIVWLEEEL